MSPLQISKYWGSQNWVKGFCSSSFPRSPPLQEIEPKKEKFIKISHLPSIFLKPNVVLKELHEQTINFTTQFSQALVWLLQLLSHIYTRWFVWSTTCRQSLAEPPFIKKKFITILQNSNLKSPIHNAYSTYIIVYQAPILWDGQGRCSSESSLAWPLDASKLICKYKPQKIIQIWEIYSPTKQSDLIEYFSSLILNLLEVQWVGEQFFSSCLNGMEVSKKWIRKTNILQYNNNCERKCRGKILIVANLYYICKLSAF